ncbi:hypothetical protein L1049_023746 [Liquidambar formosana]|uniref:Uncharacterized protein n=1 Tax=Liquidambar formosana TaxID=63359 RepID=A0AAP0RTV6_LIQFO
MVVIRSALGDSCTSCGFVGYIPSFLVRDLGLGGFDSRIGGQSGLLFSFRLFFVLLSPAVSLRMGLRLRL